MKLQLKPRTCSEIKISRTSRFRKISTSCIGNIGFVICRCTKNKNTQYNDGVERPKLVVGIVVDQMRWDFFV